MTEPSIGPSLSATSPDSIHDLAEQAAAMALAGANFTAPLAQLIAALAASGDIVKDLTTASNALHFTLGDRASTFGESAKKPLAAAYLLADRLSSLGNPGASSVLN